MVQPGHGRRLPVVAVNDVRPATQTGGWRTWGTWSGSANGVCSSMGVCLDVSSGPGWQGDAKEWAIGWVGLHAFRLLWCRASASGLCSRQGGVGRQGRAEMQ